MPRANQLSATAPVVGAVLPVARTALDAGQLETARRLYRRLLDVDPQSFEARMGLGEVAHQRRDGAQAIRWFLAALANAATATQRHDALLHHGRAALDAGQREHAQASFARLTDPQEAASNEYVAYGLNGVGLTLLLRGDLRSSVTLLEQAVDRLPGDKNLRDNLARALQLLAEDVANAADPPGTAPSGEPPDLADSAPRPGGAAPGELQSAADRIERAVARFEEAAERLADAPPRRDSAPPAQAPAPSPQPQTSAPPAETPAPPAETPAASAQPPAPAAQTPALAAETPAPAARASAPAATTETHAAETTGPAAEPPAPPAQTPRAPPDAPTRQTAQTPEPPPQQHDSPASPPKPPAPIARGSPGFVVVEGGRRFVQMGAYGTAATANALADRLQQITEQIVIVAEHGGLHRVRIGPLRTQDALRALAGALRDAGYGDLRMAAEGSPDKANDMERDARKTTTWKAFAVRVGGETFLQVGAFQARETAAARATELRELQATPVRVVAGTLASGKAAHRVRIGPLRSDAHLAAVIDTLAAAGRQISLPADTKVAIAANAPARDAPSPAGQRQEPRLAATAKDDEPPQPASPEAPLPEAPEAPAAPEVPSPKPSAAPSSAAPAFPPAAPPASEAPAPQQTPTANNGTAAAVEEVVEAALAAAEQITAAKSNQETAVEPPDAPPVSEKTVLVRGARAAVITQDAGLFIQIGDYHARADAGDLASRLRALTAEAVQVVAAKTNTPAYRVRVGPVETDADYEALRAAVASLGFEVQ